MQGRFTLRLFGAFALLGEDGRDIRPISTKGCALLALLALQESHRLERRWIESQLWSDSEAARASASLRQTLREIHKLAPKVSLLINDRRHVALNRDLFDFQSLLDNPQELDFLQGLDVRDPEFESWLSVQRSRFDQAQAAGRTLANSRTTAPSGRDRNTSIIINQLDLSSNGSFFFRATISQKIAANLLESGFSCIDLDPSTQLVSSPNNSFSLTIDTVSIANKEAVVFKVHETATRQLHWTHIEEPGSGNEMQSTADYLQLINIANIATDQIIKAASTPATEASLQRQSDALHAQAIKLLNTFDLEALDRADRLLIDAHRLHPHPKHLAWRSFLRMVMFLEGSSKPHAELIDESDALVSQANEEGADNSLVLALISQVQAQLNRDTAAAQSYAECALSINKGNALALDSSALFSLHKGDVKTALQQSDHACHVGDFSALRHWWQMSRALALLRHGQYKAAILAAERCLISAPSFRPPLRHLYPLYLHQGDTGTAALKLRQLRRLEPGFSLAMLRNNSHYPASSLRESALIELQDLPGH